MTHFKDFASVEIGLGRYTLLLVLLPLLLG